MFKSPNQQRMGGVSPDFPQRPSPAASPGAMPISPSVLKTSPCGRGRGWAIALAQIQTMDMQQCRQGVRDSPHNDAQSQHYLSPEHCNFCNRQPCNIVCRGCGNAFKGRTRSRCSLHPGTVHLMDFDCCPACKGTQLQEFAPVAVLPHKTAPQQPHELTGAAAGMSPRPS